MNPIHDENFKNFIEFIKLKKRDTSFYLCSEGYLHSAILDSTPKEYQESYNAVKEILDDIERSKKIGR